MSPIVAYGVVLLILILGGLGLERFWASETRLANNLIVTQNEVATLENLSENDQWAERHSGIKVYSCVWIRIFRR